MSEVTNITVALGIFMRDGDYLTSVSPSRLNKFLMVYIYQTQLHTKVIYSSLSVYIMSQITGSRMSLGC